MTDNDAAKKFYQNPPPDPRFEYQGTRWMNIFIKFLLPIQIIRSVINLILGIAGSLEYVGVSYMLAVLINVAAIMYLLLTLSLCWKYKKAGLVALMILFALNIIIPILEFDLIGFVVGAIWGGLNIVYFYKRRQLFGFY